MITEFFAYREIPFDSVRIVVKVLDPAVRVQVSVN